MAEEVQAKTESAVTPPAEANPTQETKVESTKPVETPKEVIPEKYDFKLPEGSFLKPTQVEKIAAYAKEQGFSQEKAQALLERENGAISSYVSDETQAFESRKAAWVDEIKADAEIGGDKTNESVEIAKRAIDKFGTPRLKEELNRTGFGNYPELVRVFSRIGRLIGEDKLVLGGVQATTGKSFAEKFYSDSATK